ncbi:MAG: hypothetical protein IT462_04300 [Planctomycetes bacterium]|nr:hypothetical protein [Planctomycetota bacterium]
MVKSNQKNKSKPQRYIDAANFRESRKTWQPDLEELDRIAARIDRQMARKTSKRKVRKPA